MNEKKVLFGADYYPEQWPKSLWDDDLSRMKSMGLEAVRIMEFAWALLEPRQGVFDFSLFDSFIDLAQKKAVQVVLGTPTATIPIWLFEKDPAIMQMHPSGIRSNFGLRRQACFCSKSYLDASINIVSQIAQRYGKNNNIIGWQVDNEIAHEGSDLCVCANCRQKWPLWLENKYQNIDHLNDSWGNVFWSTSYTNFHQVPQPLKTVHIQYNPSLLLDYARFYSDYTVAFAHRQVDLLQKFRLPQQWISTNLYAPPLNPATDMERIIEPMDFAGYDNYPVWGDMTEPLPYFFNAYVLSYIRGLKNNTNFTIFEQINGIQGHTCLGYLPPLAQISSFTNQAIALGADKIFYFRWRTAPFGQEQLCNGILDPDNSDTPLYQEIKQNIARHQADFQQFATIPVQSKACLVYDKDSARLLKHQYLSKGLYLKPNDIMQPGYDAEMARFYAPFSVFNVNTDVKSTKSVQLEQYRIISLPLYTMADEHFCSKLSQWVSQGGILILSWRSGARDSNNWATNKELPGMLGILSGVRVKRYESLNSTKVKIQIGLIPAKGEVWADLVEPIQAKVIGRYRDNRKHYKGQACFCVNQFGQGKVYYLGTSPDPIATFFLYRKIFKQSGIDHKFYGQGIEAIRRQTADGKTILAINNHTAKRKTIKGHKIDPYGFALIPI